MNSNAQLNESKPKPELGEIRPTHDGKRRRIYDGRSWQYLCTGDSFCRIQAKDLCRKHRELLSQSQSSENQLSKSPMIETTAEGNRRICKDGQWTSLCRVESCFTPAKNFCRPHRNHRRSLPLQSSNCDESSSTNRTRSQTNVNVPTVTEVSVVPKPEPATATEIQSEVTDDKAEVRTRHGRRVRCNGFIWKHLCADKKHLLSKRKVQRQSLPVTKSDQISEPKSDATETLKLVSPVAETEPTRKRKSMGDTINVNKQTVSQKKVNGKRRKGSNKINSSELAPPCNDVLPKQQPSPNEVDNDLSISLKSDRFNNRCQSTEIPLQVSPSSSTTFQYDSSSSAILEEFGTIIKKEVEEDEEESFICLSSIHPSFEDFPCETLQDFLRLEEMKKKEFRIECQRIGYRLAKIRDCLGTNF